MPEVADTFAKHFVQSIMYQRGLTEEDLLKYAYMKSALEFGSAKIEGYLGVVQADIDMLPDFFESSKIVQVLEGIQPVSFRAMIHTKYPHIVFIKGAIAIIRGASQKEQKAIDDRKAGCGNHCRGPSNSTKQREERSIRKVENLTLVDLMHVERGALTAAVIIIFQCARQDVPDAFHLIAARFHRSALAI